MRPILESEVVIHTDGSCDPNSGHGGWSAIIQYFRKSDFVEREFSGAVKDTTNNRMELTAVLESLKILKKPCSVVVYTDSKYTQQGVGTWSNGSPIVKGWMVNWAANGWRKKNGDLSNVDLWLQLYEQALRHTKVKMKYVPSHNGHILNERCDRLAAAARKTLACI